MTDKTSKPLLRIGTRSSPLAMVQAEQVRARLAMIHPELSPPGAVEITSYKTTGDQIQDKPLMEIGGKGLFTKELEIALLEERIDIAVHSLKDVATVLPDSLKIGCVLPREDPRDAFFSRTEVGLMDLPAGAIVGTASLRRRAFVLNLRPDLKVINFRGNVQTRLSKLNAGDVDATILALAGLKRLGYADKVTSILDEGDIMPAVAQGAIGIEYQIKDEKVEQWLTPLNDEKTSFTVGAERACLAVVDGSCRTPIAAIARIDGMNLSLRAKVGMPDGSKIYSAQGYGLATDYHTIGKKVGEDLRLQVGDDFFEDIKKFSSS